MAKNKRIARAIIAFFMSKPQNSIKISPTIEKMHKSHKNRPTSSESIQSQRVDSSRSPSKIAERVDYNS
jgi:hypothetical protein